MSKYKEIDGNLLDLFDEGEFDVIAHGANCFSTMGAGIAKQIRERYPEAYYADIYYSLNEEERLGNFTCTSDGSIVNLYTQYHPGANFCYSAFRLAIRKLEHYFGNKGYKFGFPMIGCGIGGGNWNKVKAIIQKELKDEDVTIVFYNEVEQEKY